MTDYDADFIRARREHLGYSQVDVVRLMADKGVTGFYQTTLSRLEQGTSRLSLHVAVALAAVLECELRDIAGVENARMFTGHAYHAGYLAGLRDARNAVAALDGGRP